ncbi:hypothetical protein QYE76_024062 [Lolium multiflorum]|uniref:phosphopyruvate hydratase n=1 Tax=Lolium multiflorum TaxID=4521 RepID=A0AAD8VVD3_LOLMU|nr:hypothetical protein QYE76_024062 [Lolium multiflorum]
MNVAASEFNGEKDQTYDLNFKEENNDGSQKISGDSMKNVYKSFVDEYQIFSIEDLFDQDDWVHYAKMTEEIGEQVHIVGGTVAQLALRRALASSHSLWEEAPRGVAKAIAEKSCNALLLKVNHSVLEAVRISILVGCGVMTSHRRIWA